MNLEENREQRKTTEDEKVKKRLTDERNGLFLWRREREMCDDIEGKEGINIGVE